MAYISKTPDWFVRYNTIRYDVICKYLTYLTYDYKNWRIASLVYQTKSEAKRNKDKRKYNEPM